MSKRLRKYFSKNHLKKVLLRNKSNILAALLKYDYSNFNLEILEYCEPNLVIVREQYYLDLLKLEYNIYKMAGLTFGKIHIIVTKEKISLPIKA